MRIKGLVALFALALVCVLAATPLAAQETRGAIEGTITDASGAVLPGVTVEARGAGGVFTSVTDARGAYRFPSLAPGGYEVTATLEGFNPAKRTVNLVVGQLLKVDLPLAIAGLSETVQVSGEAPTIDVKQATAATNIQAAEIDKLPKGRNFTDLVTLAPGANQESRSGGISVDGASAAENKYYLDGVDTTNLQTGVAATTVLPDFIQEVQIKSSGYSAEFGGATGGVISVISKSGTNMFRGEVGGYLNNDAMNGAARQTLRLVLTGANESEYITYPKDSYQRLEPFVQLGGPILKDRLWFWGGYTPTLENTERTVTFRTNKETKTFTSDETTHNIVGNVTAALTNSLRLRVSAQNRPYTQDGQLPAIDGTSNPAAFFGIETDRPNLTSNTSLDWVASNRLFFNTKFNYLQYDWKESGIPSDIRYVFSASSNTMFETRSDMIRPNNWSNLLTNRARLEDKFTRFGWSADATAYLNGGGQHTVKGGVQFERIGNTVNRVDQAPVISLNWNMPRTTLDGRIEQGAYGYYSWTQYGTIGDVSVTNLGLFLQDSWTVNDKLTINLGVRTEKEDVPSYTEGLDGIKFSFADKLAPRAGFAYDVKGDGRWKVYGSWGVFYDVMKLELPRGSFGGDKWIEHYYTLDTLDWNTLGVGGSFPGKFLEDVNYRIPSNDPSCPECGAIDPDLKPFKQQEMVVGLEHELNPRMAVSARYVHKQVDETIEDVGVMVPGIGEVFMIANPGRGVAQKIDGPEYPAMPEAKRDYDALELKFTRRFANRWMFNTSYTLSRLTGNYPGLASSDEVARVSPNVTRLFDGLLMAFDQTGKPLYGLLNTDRPHQVKVNGIYQIPVTDTTLGLVYRIASGIPITRQANFMSSLPVFYQGRVSDGRTAVYHQTDMSVQQDIRLGSRVRAQVSLTVMNLFDQKGEVDVWRVATRQNVPVADGTSFTEADFFNGFDGEEVITRFNIRRDPRFLQTNTYQAARNILLGMKLTF